MKTNHNSVHCFTLREILPIAEKGGYAVGSFSPRYTAMIAPVLQAGQSANAPLIVQISQKEFARYELSPAEFAAEFYELLAGLRFSIPVVLHLDHTREPEIIYAAIAAGFTSVMIDASEKSLEENIAISRAIAEYAHARGVSVEAELGRIGTTDRVETDEDVEFYTQPDEALRFVQETRVDALAVSVGTAHGVYLVRQPKIDYARLMAICALTPVSLVIHGGSGIPDEMLKAAYRLPGGGVSKVNIATDLELAALGALGREKYLTNAAWQALAPAQLGAAQAAVRQTVLDKIEHFLGSTGKAVDFADLLKMKLRALSPSLLVFEDTCRVYALRSGQAAVLVDFGSGDILQALPEAGIHTVTDVLVTHHHRDQVQGLARAAQAGARIWVPFCEQDLFRAAEQHWAGREIFLNYNMRQDRFGPLENLPVDGLLEDYATYDFGGRPWQVVPTPGHTPGSLSLVVAVDGKRLAFCGDLLHSPGKLWSLAATQWSYNGGEGLPATVCSLLDLKARGVEVLLPSHGAALEPAAAAVDQTVARLAELMRARGQNPRLFQFMAEPYSPITPHLLRSRQSTANSFLLRSESGSGLLIDFGYDFMTGSAPGSDRAARRPWLYSLEALKRTAGIRRVAVVLPTHYHDDHVAGINLLRRVEGTHSWIPENFAGILADPARYDLPCLWYDPIPADRVLPLGEPLVWEEYTLRLHPLPGHTRHAVAIEFEVDGTRVLAVGDQHQNDDGLAWNYVYQNRFAPGDYRETAGLYARLQPQLILSGHWEPLWVQPGYVEELAQRAALLERLHVELLPPEIEGFGLEGFGARLEPYQVLARAGEAFELTAEIYNPARRAAEAEIALVLPAGWQAAPAVRRAGLPPLGSLRLGFQVTPPAGARANRQRLALELTIAGQKYGQQAEALVSLRKE